MASSGWRNRKGLGLRCFQEHSDRTATLMPSEPNLSLRTRLRRNRLWGEADGAFRPSDTQWTSLRLAMVRQVAFRDERATDGKIAINEDTTTPVFSPYSG